MRDVRGNSLADRLQNRTAAKQALMERLSKLPKPNDPELVARRAERAAATERRRIAKAEREAAKAKVEQERREREAAARIAEAEHAARLAREEADRQLELLAQQKAARDARYAARKRRKARA